MIQIEREDGGKRGRFVISVNKAVLYGRIP